jgi:hypothetical protein
MDEKPYGSPLRRRRLRAYLAGACILIGTLLLIYAAAVAVGALGVVMIGVLLAAPFFYLAARLLRQ